MSQGLDVADDVVSHPGQNAFSFYLSFTHKKREDDSSPEETSIPPTLEVLHDECLKRTQCWCVYNSVRPFLARAASLVSDAAGRYLPVAKRPESWQSKQTPEAQCFLPQQTTSQRMRRLHVRKSEL
ncbi:hypothetical protein C0Q70_17136 [Pomacea canaliculata]|uniref:Uncharacterized protein n=1 Tax=Pomacea canaliculata TaxID=400727 RepID=A0A2T7NRT5_POMCA|nr:hypothetical protein C0Q70_17136 [Pomacea canaliculata]